MMQKTTPGVALTAAAVIAVLSVAAAAWAINSAKQAKAAAQAAEEERDRAKIAAEDAAEKCKLALAGQQTAEHERNQTATDEQQARQAADDAKTALDFVRDKILSAGRPLDWTKPPKKDVTLREAVDATLPQVAGAFPDRPLAEALVRSMLGWTYFYLGEAKLAAEQYEQALTLRESVLGPDDPATVGSRNDLARAYRVIGSVDKAGDLYNRKAAAPASAMAARGAKLLEQNREVQAETVLRECLTSYEETQPDAWSTYDVTSMLGEALFALRKYDDAEPLLVSGYEGLKQREADIPPASKDCLIKAIERLVHFYEARGNSDEAAKWRKELEAAQAAAKS